MKIQLLAALAVLTPVVSGQAFVFEIAGTFGRSIDGQFWIGGGVPPNATLRAVAEDGSGRHLAALECPGGCPMAGALELDGVRIADFPAPATDIDVTCEGEALVVAGDVYRVDLNTLTTTMVWSPSTSGFGAPIAVAGVCGGAFYVATVAGSGTQLVFVDGFLETVVNHNGGNLVDVDSNCDGTEVLYTVTDEVYMLGAMTPLYTWSTFGSSIEGAAIDNEGNWAVSIDDDANSSNGIIVVNGVVQHMALNMITGDIDAYLPRSSATLRLGTPANAPALFATQGPPHVGETWEALIFHTTFYPNAQFDFLALSTKPPVEIPLAIGTLLCLPPPPAQIFVVPAGTPFQVPMPADCNFLGRDICCQGGSIGLGYIELTNALDLVLGV